MKRNFRVFFARITAYSIDFLILVAVDFFINYFIQLPGRVNQLLEDVLALSYFIGFHWKRGQTYGKRFFHIKVVDFLSDQNLSLNQALKREFIWLVIMIIDWSVKILFQNLSTGIFFNLSYLLTLGVLITILIDKNFRGIHDKLAGTKVVSLN